jgi:hypothetical protein
MDSGLQWENVNFFTNGFSSDVGEILFGVEPKDPAHVSLFSPDNTSDGWLRKKWIISSGKRYLMKGGSRPFRQEPFNEVAASAIMRRLGIAHIPYTLTFDADTPYSLCENFITADTELIPAWRVRETLKKDNSHSELTHLLRCCDTLGIPEVKHTLDKMLTVDYLIANEDRHWGNFGFVRNAETLLWQGLAPVYDNGTSLWFDARFVGMPVGSKPFRKTHEEQIKLVSDLSWFNADKLKDLDEEITEIFKSAPDVDIARREAIASAVMERGKQVEQMRQRQVTINKKNPSLLAELEDSKRQAEAERKNTPRGGYIDREDR